MSKNLIIIISGVVIAAIVGVGIYFGVHKKGESTPNIPSQEQSQVNQENQQGETSGGQVADKLSQLKKFYQGFRKAKIGDWAVWKIESTEGIPRVKYVYAGQETVDGKNCYGWEFSGKAQGIEAAMQVWLSKKDGNPVKYVAKVPQGVFCLSPSKYKPPEGEFSPQAETPDDYKPENIINLNFETGTFTTESGKTIKVVKIIHPDRSQIWLSSQIPFGVAKVISTDGKTEAELKDFGSGAPLEITKNERDNCRQIPSGLFGF